MGMIMTLLASTDNILLYFGVRKNEHVRGFVHKTEHAIVHKWTNKKRQAKGHPEMSFGTTMPKSAGVE